MSRSPSFAALSIVIPVRDERQRIGPLVRQLREVAGPSVEILVVDDGSTDRSGEEAAQAGTRVFRHPYPIGNGAGIKRAIRAARGERILLLDGDGQHDPADLPKLLALADRYDLVVGSRRFRDQASLPRALANWVYNGLASYVTEQRVEDLTSGFRLLRREDVLPFLSILPNRFSYPATLTMAYLRSGRSVGYVPVTVRKRSGKSKLVWWEDGIRFFLIILKITTLYAPLRIFLPVSLGFLGLGFGYYAYTFAAFHRFTSMGVLLMITGILIFLMGLIAEAVAELRFQQCDGGS